MISAKFVPLKYYTLSSQLPCSTVECSGRGILSPGQIAIINTIWEQSIPMKCSSCVGLGERGGAKGEWNFIVKMRSIVVANLRGKLGEDSRLLRYAFLRFCPQLMVQDHMLLTINNLEEYSKSNMLQDHIEMHTAPGACSKYSWSIVHSNNAPGAYLTYNITPDYLWSRTISIKSRPKSPKSLRYWSWMTNPIIANVNTVSVTSSVFLNPTTHSTQLKIIMYFTDFRPSFNVNGVKVSLHS